MAYDEGLAQRLREAVEEDPRVTEKKMFGGLCFLMSGNMCFGVVKDELMVRVGPDAYEECLAHPDAREMDFTGRALKGMVYISVEGIEEDDDLQRWIGHGLAFARSLPPKQSLKKPPKKLPSEFSKKKASSRKKARKRTTSKKRG